MLRILKPALLSLLLYASGVFSILAPLPLLVAGVKGRSRDAVLAFCAAGLGVLILYAALSHTPLNPLLPRFAIQSELRWWEGGGYGMLLYAFYGGMAFFLLTAHRKGWSGLRFFGYFIGFFGIGVGIFYAFIAYWAGKSPMGLFEDHFFVFLRQWRESAAQSGSSPDWLGEAEMKALAHQVVRLLPGMAAVWMGLILLLNLSLGKRFARPLPVWKAAGEFVRWRLPFGAVWPVLGAIAFLILNSYGLAGGAWGGFLVDIAANLLVIGSALYAVQGVAIFRFWLSKWKVGPLGQMLAWGVLLFFAQLLFPVLAGFGFFDSWLDFRRFEKGPKGE